MNAEQFRDHLGTVLADVPKEQRPAIEKLFHTIFKQQRKEAAPVPEPVTPAPCEHCKELAQQLRDAEYNAKFYEANGKRYLETIQKQEEQIAELERYPGIKLPASINLHAINYNMLERLASRPLDHDGLERTLKSKWLKVAEYYKMPRFAELVKSFSANSMTSCLHLGFSEAAWWQAICCKKSGEIPQTVIPVENKE